MDVSCPRCSEVFAFDTDSQSMKGRLRAGFTIRCTECSHVFSIRVGSVAPPDVDEAAPTNTVSARELERAAGHMKPSDGRDKPSAFDFEFDDVIPPTTDDARQLVAGTKSMRVAS